MRAWVLLVASALVVSCGSDDATTPTSTANTTPLPAIPLTNTVPTAVQASTAPTVIKAPDPKPNLTTWSYKEKEDPMGRAPSKYAQVASSNEFEFGFPYAGSQRALLLVRTESNDGKAIALGIEKGQFMCNSYDGCRVMVRFDDEKAQSFRATTPSDENTAFLFLSGYDKFLKGVRKSKKVLIEAEFFQEGTKILEFNVSDFKW